MTSLTKFPMLAHIPEHAPRMGGAIWRGAGRFLMRLWGWRLTGKFPEDKKVLLIAAPHTSNWDWVIGVSALMATGLQLSYIAKHSLFVGPLGWFMRLTGAIPVDRSKAGGTVASIVDQFRQQDVLYYAIAPEGTRQHIDRWKTGFLRVAYDAKVPVVMVSFDYPSKTILIGPKAELSGEMEQDLRLVQSYYRHFRGCVRAG